MKLVVQDRMFYYLDLCLFISNYLVLFIRTAFDQTENLEEQAELVIQILIPVCITLFFVIAILKVASFSASYQISPVLVYRENASDSGSKKFFGSVLNALIFVGIMVVVTFLFVLLYKYRCMKV